MSEALLILNGKKAGRPEIRQAVNTLRDAEHQLDVRVTWEAGDIHRYIDEACRIPSDPLESLRLALTGESRSIDAVQANEQFFLNVASVGFGAAVTANTPVELKNFLGGGAYTIAGLIQALKFDSFLGSSKRYRSGIAAGLPVHPVMRSLDLIPL